MPPVPPGGEKTHQKDQAVGLRKPAARVGGGEVCHAQAHRRSVAVTAQDVAVALEAPDELAHVLECVLEGVGFEVVRLWARATA